MNADLDALTREAMAETRPDDRDVIMSGEWVPPGFDAVRHAIRFTLSRYAPHELPDPVKELAAKLRAEWAKEGGCIPTEAVTKFIIRRTREEDAKVAK